MQPVFIGHNERNRAIISVLMCTFVECLKRMKINERAYFELFLHFGQFPLQGSALSLLRFCHGVASVALQQKVQVNRL